MLINQQDPLLCEKCALCRFRKQVVLPTACTSGGLLAIGEAPGAEEDATGAGFIGSAGKTLESLLQAYGYRRGETHGVANVVRCRPPGNRLPRTAEVKACVPWLADAIAEIQPRVLLLVGTTAANTFLGKETSLGQKVADSQNQQHCDFSNSHPAFQARLREQYPDLLLRGILAVPMPHTSGIGWNQRNPLDGRRWSEIGDEQVQLAISLVTGNKPVRISPAPEQTSLDL